MRISETKDVSVGELSTVAQTVKKTHTPFRPRPMTDFAGAGLNFAQVESLVLKFLIGIGVASGRRIAEELGMPFGPFPEFLRNLKNQQVVAYTDSTTANDYLYSLTDMGRARARIYLDECSY